ncbi:hypothetical protein L2719_14890 [Shewanella schlegeliana]|uniref:Uncharacterized protein n=1 Tax=Shewanella schlegeliana TaxID=190308 RepID=A0ABS1T028_9GAMM|nr:hypothetical protein [Shewanella schlegeliana]MBL4914142.1 hypothetical protein [Shewanella schlegeliana]MCL1110821.1 hypothetical protein [Shewanella schlegeliana]GIU36378.1 hypothetical protein TUM4433_35050 [Shewanella schlegeliana]
MLDSNPPISNPLVSNGLVSNSQAQVSPSSPHRQQAPKPNNAAVLQTDTVTLSAKSIALCNQALESNPSQTLPAQPKRPNEGEKIEGYVEFKKAKMQYQIYADMANIATGRDNNVSPATVYYLSNNDDARAATLNAKAQQQQIASMQTYVETNQESNNT